MNTELTPKEILELERESENVYHQIDFEIHKANLIAKLGLNISDTAITERYSDYLLRLSAQRLAYIAASTKYTLLLKEEKERAKGLVDELRKLFSDYVKTEGCSCCQDEVPHSIAAAGIAELLGFEKYKDGSGYNFYELPNKSVDNGK